MLTLLIRPLGTDCRRVEDGSQLSAVAAPSAKKSHTSSSPHPASASTDAAQDASPPPAPPVAKAKKSALRD